MMLKVTRANKTTVHRTMRITLSGGDIVDLLRSAGHDIRPTTPGKVTVTVYAPGGGDWSNPDLNHEYVTVEWTEEYSYED